jgi:NADPH:quinone reductase
MAGASYQALLCERLSDDLSGFNFRRLERRALAPQEVRLRVLRVALNFPDLLMSQGLYQFKPTLPFVPGMEGVGQVIEVGASGGSIKTGECVCFSTKTGGLAQELVLDQRALRRCPVGLSLDEAAAHFVTGLTAWVALSEVAQLRSGETLLVHGARGGVGSACVQLGQYLGARVIATASDPSSLTLATPGHENFSVLAADEQFPDKVMTLTAGRGVDVVADPVGGDLFNASIQCCGWGARLLVLGFAAGQIPTLKLQRLLFKGLTVHGVRAGEYGRQHPAKAVQHEAAVARLAQAGVFRPHVGFKAPLAQALEAFRAMKERRFIGKIVVEVNDE